MARCGCRSGPLTDEQKAILRRWMAKGHQAIADAIYQGNEELASLVREIDPKQAKAAGIDWI